MNLHKQLALMLANLRKRRPYYCEVEYLESDGGQWFNTGFNINTSTDEVVFNFQLISTTKYQWIMGEHDNGARFCIGVGDGTNLRNVAYGVTTYKVNDTEMYNSIHYFVANSNGAYLNGTQVHGFESFVSTNSIYMFALNLNGSVSSDRASGKIWKYTQKRNGRAIIDLIPVLDWNMTPCMYDKVTGRFFYNQGTGNFTYGREIHYVDYIESTGTQYIDTGVTLTNNHSVEIDYQLTSASQNRKGIFGGLGANGPRFGVLLSPSNNYLEFGYGSTNVWYQQGLPDTQRHIMKQQKNLLYFDGVLTYTFSTATFTQNFTATLGNFTYINYNPASAKYYSSKWWDGDTLVRDYLPAIDENGVGFMFDRVERKIYDNAGTGVFKYPAREVEYIQSTGTQYIDTGVILSSTDKVEASAEYTGAPTNGSSYIFGTYGSSKNFGINRDFVFTTDNGGYCVWGASSTKLSVPVYSNTIQTFVLDSTGCYIDGVKGYTPSGTFTGTAPAYLFWANGTSQQKSIMRLYYTKIWNNNNTIVRDFIPCYKDGQAGMLDKVNSVFYPNNGTGTFTTGKIVEPEYE